MKLRIFIDADAFPVALKEIMLKSVLRHDIALFVVANSHIRFPEHANIKHVFVKGGPDMADDYIVEEIEKDDLAITFDIPLASRVVKKGAIAISPRGELYEERNINQKLAVRDLLDELRSNGMNLGGPAAFSSKDRETFANQLNKFVSKYFKKQNMLLNDSSTL